MELLLTKDAGEQEDRRIKLGIPQGILGGVVAGGAVAAWLFAVDLLGGHPFQTPGRLASLLLHEEYTGPWPRHVFLFTVLHFGVFATLGVMGAWFLQRIGLEPGIIPGLFFGLVVLNVVHYSGLLITGTNLLTVVPAIHVVVSNLLGGLLMMAILGRSRGSLGLGRRPELSSTLRSGIATGLAGAITVALWFFFCDLLTDSPFRTPAILGSAVLLGTESAAEVEVNPSVIGAYSLLHVSVFFVLGVALVWLARRFRENPGFLLPGLTGLVLLEALFLGTVWLTSDWVLATLGWWVILIGNVVAAGAMSSWIWLKDPELRQAAGASSP